MEIKTIEKLKKIDLNDDLETAEFAVEILTSQEFVEKLVSYAATEKKVIQLTEKLIETIRAFDNKLNLKVSDVLSACYTICIIYLAKSLKNF